MQQPGRNCISKELPGALPQDLLLILVLKIKKRSVIIPSLPILQILRLY